MYLDRIVSLTIIFKQRVMSEIKGFLQLSSVSRKILEAVKCPVMIIDLHD